ncbi:MAG: peptidylprolyl isomerase [Anaerolineales bacterium]
MDNKNPTREVLVILFFLFFIVSACSGGGQAETLTATPILPTRTPFPPPPTPIPTTAIVNGDLITIEEFQEELARYKAAVNRELTEDDQSLVINDLINLILLAQAAKSEGYQISDTELDARIAVLDTEDQPLADWLAAYGFTEASFRIHLKRSLEAAWMRDQIISDVAQEIGQVHAQQMLFYSLSAAEITMEELDEGKDFSQLASTYDPQTRGDLGWFPEGYLTIPDLDPIIFSLDIGETSDIIETKIGYHIIKVLDKQENRPIDPAIRQILGEKALDDWLERRWKLSTIDITLPL